MENLPFFTVEVSKLNWFSGTQPDAVQVVRDTPEALQSH